METNMSQREAREGKTSRRISVISVLSAAFVLLASITWASIPDASGVIHSCYSQAKGTWRPIDFPKQSCQSGEIELHWNQTGPQGPVGPAGATGATGPTGAGGPAGTNGKTIYNGSGSPSNSLGTDGDFYIDTTNVLLYGPRAGGVWPAGINLVGPKGDKGDQGLEGTQGIQGVQGVPGLNGKSVLNGSGSPSAHVGVDGDFYIDTTAATLYGPKSEGAWPTAGVSLIGPKGDTGDPGIQTPQSCPAGQFVTGIEAGGVLDCAVPTNFVSPNGVFSLAVGNGGIVLSGPGGSLTFAGPTTTILGNVYLGGANNCPQVARVGDHASGASGEVTIYTGSGFVFAC